MNHCTGSVTIADAVVTDCLKKDRNSRVAIEVLIKNYDIIIAGELTSRHNPDYRKLVKGVFDRIGKDILGYDADCFCVQVLVSQQSPDIAQGVVRAGFAERCEVQISYVIGVADPVSIHVETFGTESQEQDFIEDYIKGNYDLTPQGIIEGLNLLDVDYNQVSAYGHFGKEGLPWEK